VSTMDTTLRHGKAATLGPKALKRPTGRGPARRSSPRTVSLALVVLKPWAEWATRTALVGRNRSRSDAAQGRFSSAEVRRILRNAWSTFDRLVPELPAKPTVGSRQNVLLACLTLAMFEALLDEGIDRAYAIELVSDACWNVYGQWAQIPKLVSRLGTRDPVGRMRSCVDMFLRFPFNRPGYVYEDRPEPKGRALDILRCPVADYLGAHDASDLAVGSWCNLDFQLARMWSGTLERHGSLAGGAPRCDFRFRANTRQAS